MFYTLLFIDNARNVASWLSNLVNNLSERIDKIKCKYGHDDKKCETCITKYKYCDCFHNLHNDLPFLPEMMKIEKLKKLVVNLHDKTEYIIYIRNLKLALNHEIVLKRFHGAIKFNQNGWLKPYNDVSTELKKAKHGFKNDFFKLINNAVFGKTVENVRKHRDIKLVRKEKRKNYLVSEPNYHNTKFFTEYLLPIEI